jgi:hypothetical protein
MRVWTGEHRAGRRAASGAGYAHATPSAQPTEFTGTSEHLLALLSRSRPSPSTIADQTVSRVVRLSLLRAEQGPAAAVLKVARGLPGAEELRTQRRVLAEIASHPGLDEEWRELLPRAPMTTLPSVEDAAQARVNEADG